MPARELKVPQSVVVSVTLGLFAVALFAARQYGLVGELRDLTLAVIAGVICALMIAGLIWANYKSYMQWPQGSVNGSP